MALAWSIQYLFLSFTRNRTIRSIIKGLADLTLFPLKHLDRFLIDRPGAFDAASAYFFMGKKIEGDDKFPKQILLQYRGAMLA